MSSEEPEPLTEEQRGILEAALRELRETLQHVSEASKEGVKPVVLDQASVGRLSRMDSIAVQQMAKASQRNQQVRLQQVNQALRRIASGDYGDCLRCEEPIGFPRLEARPESVLCLICQSARERS